MANWENVDLKDILVNLSEVFNQDFFKLFFSFVFRFAESLSDQRKERVIFLIVKKQLYISNWFIPDSDSDFFIDGISSF